MYMCVNVGLLFCREVKAVITNYVYDYIILLSGVCFFLISPERKYKISKAGT